MYRVELKGLKLNRCSTSWNFKFLMYRVELKEGHVIT